MSNAQTMIVATAPAKIQAFLRRANDRGLTVGLTEHTYWVSSPNPVDDFQVWLHYTAGANGGRIVATLYTPSSNKRTTKKITQKDARYWIAEMADGLDRHHAREAAKADMDTRNTANLTAADYNTQDAPAPHVPTVAFAPAPAVEPLPADVEAELVLAGLRANGRFAVRAARHGHIPVNTPLKVRVALVRRGLVDAAGGILTDLGRAARVQLLGA